MRSILLTLPPGVLLMLALFLPGRSLGLATPPLNDRCAGALIVSNTISATEPYVSPVIEVSTATVDGDPPLPVECGTNVSRSIWFRFRPATTAIYTLSVGRDTSTTVEDTIMALYTASSPCSGYTLFACNDDAGLLKSAISTNLTANITYYVVVWVGPVTDVSKTPLNIQLRVSMPVVPDNNVCAQAEVIPLDATLPYLTAITDTTLADETNDPPSSCASGGRSVWYQFSPPATGIYIFSTGSDTATTVDDTALTIYRNSGGCGGTFTQVLCSDNGFGRALDSASLTSGQTYYIVVWDETFESMPPAPSGYIPGETWVQLRVSRATAPTVVTLGASSIASTGAVLTASINPNGGARSGYWFEWGTTTGYGSTSSVRLLLSGTASVTNSIPIGGYAANTTIHYRAVATNSVGRSNGIDRTFLYSSMRPQVFGSSIASVAGGSYHFTFIGAPAHLYLAQASTNLSAWIDVGTAQESSTPGQYRSPQAVSQIATQRFFRVRLP